MLVLRFDADEDVVVISASCSRRRRILAYIYLQSSSCDKPLLDIVRVLGDGALEKAQNQRTGEAHLAASDLGVRGKAQSPGRQSRTAWRTVGFRSACGLSYRRYPC